MIINTESSVVGKHLWNSWERLWPINDAYWVRRLVACNYRCRNVW